MDTLKRITRTVIQRYWNKSTKFEKSDKDRLTLKIQLAITH